MTRFERAKDRDHTPPFVTDPLQRHDARAGTDTHTRFQSGALTLLNQVVETLNKSINLAELLDQTLITVCRAVAASWGVIRLLDSAGEHLNLAAQHDAPGVFIQGSQRVRRDKSSIWHMIEQMQPVSHETITVGAQRPLSVNLVHVLLTSKGYAVGILTIGQNGRRVALPEWAPQLSVLGHQIGSALAHATMYEWFQLHNRKLDNMKRLAGVMMSRLDPTDVLSVIVHGLVQHWDAALACVWLTEQRENGAGLILRASAGPSRGIVSDLTPILLAEENAITRIAKQCRGFLSIDPENDMALASPNSLRREAIASFAGYPLVYNGRVAGVIGLFSRETLRQTDYDLLYSFAHQAAAAIENARVYAREQQRMQELTALARRLQHSQARLVQSEKMAAAGRLAASMAHEINNPLQAIHNCLTLAQRFPLETQEHSDYLALAGQEVERLIRFVQRTLEFCRPSRGYRTVADLNALVRHVVALIRNKLEYNEIELILSLSSQLDRVRIVNDQISQVILNLIVNSIEAQPDGGRLELATQQRGEWVEIVVKDGGPGLSQAQLEHLFEPFFTTKPAGTGLGLAISFGIIERHGGTIHAESAGGEGTVFIVRLPAVAAEGIC